MNLDRLLQKSRDIARLNAELSLKLKENEVIATEVEKEINFFRQKIGDAEKSKTEISVLRENLENISQQNKKLYRNIELLKEDLLLRNSHLNILRKKVVEMKGSPLEIQKKEEEKRLQENEISKLKNNIIILKKDLIEKDRHLNVLRRSIVKKKTKDKEGKLDSRIIFLEEENSSLRKKLEEIKEREAKIKEQIDKETKMLLVVSRKLRDEMSEKDRLSKSVLRVDQLEEENRKLSVLLGNSRKESGEKKEKVNILEAELSRKKAVFANSSKALEKLKKGLELSIKRSREFEKRKIMLNKRISDLEAELESAKKKMEEKEQDFKKIIEDEKNKNKAHIMKFIRQYSRSRLYSESEIKELKGKMEKLKEDKSFLLAKIEFLKKIIAESTKKELDTRSELEILKKKI